MSTNSQSTTDRRSTAQSAQPTDRGHELVHVSEYVPGDEPTDADIELSPGSGYQTRFWRCRNCGQERNRRDEFREACPVEDPSLPIEECGYAVDQPRTRRALTEDMDVRFGDRGPVYVVESESGNTYEVDVDERTCTCPDYRKRAPEGGCKHIRRVVIGIYGGSIPNTDGSFHTSRAPRPAPALR